MLVKRADIITELQSEILRMQGFKNNTAGQTDICLGPINAAFPNSTFPVGAVHEFLTERSEDAAAACGFISGLLSALMGRNGASVWVSASRPVFPPGLKNFGLHPERFIFTDVQREKDVLWVMNEALKCSALTAVVGEIHDVSFTESRRLQLSVEESQVTGFVFRRSTRNINTTAFVSRWKIESLSSSSIDGLPGIGFPKWKVELLRIRNGKPGAWILEWKHDRFVAEDIETNHQIASAELVAIEPFEFIHQKQAG
jgi:protein ImuA